MKISINQLRLELADILEGHLQMNTFFWGDFPRAVNEDNINYPLMASYYPTASLLDNQTSLPITIVIADKIYEDYTNLNDVESDTLQYCRDVFNIMNKSTRWQKLGRVESCSLTKFIEGNADVCAGHIMTVNFTLRDTNSICDLPMSGYDFDQVIGASCLPVQIYRNGVLVDTIESGGTYSYTTDDFTYTIKNTALTTLYSGDVTANLSVTIQDATVENSDASYSASILAEGSLVLPDVTVEVQNSALTVVNTATVASVQDVTISAPDGTINIKKTGDGTISSQSVPSGATVNYDVADNAITVNSANGFSIDATDPLDIVLTDGTSSVTPTSVTYSQGQHKVDIVLPAPTTPSPRSTSALMKTGQTTSYRTGDDGDLEAGRATSFLVLDTAPLHNNGSATLNTTTNRFTDTLGGQTYIDNIVLDWSTWDGSTILGLSRVSIATGNTWNQSIDNSISYSVGTFTSGWRLPNLREIFNLLNFDNAPSNLLNYTPLNLSSTGRIYWSSTTVLSSTTLAYVFSNVGLTNQASKTSSVAYTYFPVRTFSLSTSNTLT